MGIKNDFFLNPMKNVNVCFYIKIKTFFFCLIKNAGENHIIVNLIFYRGFFLLFLKSIFIANV